MYLLFSFYRNVVSFVEIYDKIVLLKWKRGDVKLDVIVTRTNREEKKSVYEFLEETLQIDLSSVYGGVFGHQVTVDRKDKKNFLEIKTKQVELSLDEIREEENAFIERLTSKKIEEISKGITNDEKERLLSYFRQRLNEYKVYKLKYEVRNDIRSLDDNYIKEYESLWNDIESSAFAPEIQMYFSIHEKEYEESLNYKYYAELLKDLENKLGHFKKSSTEYNLRKIIKLCNEVENVIRGIEKVTKEVIADQRELEEWMYEYDEKYLALSIDKLIENASSSEEMVNEYAKKMLMYFLCEKLERIFASEIYEIADSGENNREQEKKTERLINKVKKDIEPYQDLSEEIFIAKLSEERKKFIRGELYQNFKKMVKQNRWETLDELNGVSGIMLVEAIYSGIIKFLEFILCSKPTRNSSLSVEEYSERVHTLYSFTKAFAKIQTECPSASKAQIAELAYCCLFSIGYIVKRTSKSEKEKRIKGWELISEFADLINEFPWSQARDYVESKHVKRQNGELYLNDLFEKLIGADLYDDYIYEDAKTKEAQFYSYICKTVMYTLNQGR